MAIRVICPHCQQQSTAPDRLSGQCAPLPALRSESESPAVLVRTETVRTELAANQAPADGPAKNGAHKEESHADPHGSDPFNQPRKSQDMSDLIDMTAMVDIVFFLLIYFLVTSFVALSASIRAPFTEGRTASSSSAGAQSESQTLTVKIDADDAVWIDQEPAFGSREIYLRLRNSQQETGAERLRVAASPEATHGKLVLVLDAGISAGFKSAQVGLEDVQ